MSELVVGSIAGLAANSYVVDVASGSTLDLSAGAVFPAGSIIQVVTADYAGADESTATLAATSLQATITPKFATSKIIVMASAASRIERASAQQSGQARYNIWRDPAGTPVVLPGTIQFGYSDSAGAANRWLESSVAIAVYDSPATTSAVTYALAMQVQTGDLVTTKFLGASGASIIVMEVAG